MRIATLAGLAVLFIALVPASASPADEVIPRPGGGPALIVPADSPVRFTGFDENGVAHFTGRFTLTGTFVYGCPAACEAGMTKDDIELRLIPDPALAARLPHWQDRGDGMVVDIGDFGRLAPTIASDASVQQMLSGKIPDVHGRIEIEVDNYAADFGCDFSPYYAARFVALAKRIEVAELPADANFGCL